jgi:EAL and modified HD-GYP domain-containing signal transduction protein
MELFIARQPIFTQQQQVYAYELLFRSGTANVFPEVDANHASARVMMDSLCTLGLETLTGGKRAFINMTRDLLVGDYAMLLPKDGTVIEVLESVTPDEQVVAACQQLKEAGYVIALDDFVEKAAMAPLTALADIIKVDFLTTRPGERRARPGPGTARFLRRMPRPGTRLRCRRDAGGSGYLRARLREPTGHKRRC